jgi:MFS family permease
MKVKQLPATGSRQVGGFRSSAAYLVIVLTFTNTLSYLDRQIINILAEPIKQEFALRDWQIGALTGLAFGLVYIGATLPMGRLAERIHRGRLISFALAFWSSCTVLCAFTQSFLQLAIARAGLGLGEAALTPAAQSLVADRVPQDRRGLALSILSTGVPIGTMIGMAVGGVIADQYGWRAAFLVCGAPGLLAVVATLLMNDPRHSQGAALQPIPKFRQAVAELWARPSFQLVLTGAALMAFIGLAQNAFHSAYLIRAHGPALASLGSGMPTPMGALAFVGVTLGVGGGILGVAGALAGGWTTDRLVSRYGPRQYTSILILSAVASIPLAIGAVTFENPVMAIASASLTSFARMFSAGALLAAVQALATPQQRATAAALLVFSLNVVGLALGPLGVGALSDVFAIAGYGVAGGLRMSLLTVETLALVAVILFWLAGQRFARDAASLHAREVFAAG